MTFSMAAKFALQNLKANRSLEVPFVCSASIMFGLFNIMSTLLGNHYVQTRHTTLPMIIAFGAFLVGIFTVVFVVYTTNFLLKRRNKEFALYGILGLEKKHIRKIISIEFLVLFLMILTLSIPGGYLFGQLTFLGLNRLMQDVSGGLMDYGFSLPAMFLTILLGMGLYLYALLRSSFRIYLSTPVSLLGQQHSGEGEPKSRYVLLLAGMVSMAAGYYIAWTTEGILSSLLYFFLAALLVILGTYLLYVTFSVVYLKFRKKQKSYYKPLKFLEISGLLYRLKSNAVSLASISILSTGVILTLSATAAIYSNIQSVAQNALPREYRMENPVSLNENNVQDVTEETEKNVLSTVEDPSQIINLFTGYEMSTTIARKGDEFVSYAYGDDTIPNFVLFYDLNSYNKRTGKNMQLENNEILVCSNQTSMVNMDTLKIGEQTFSVTKIENIVPSNYAVEVYCIIAKDFETLQYFSRVLPALNIETHEMGPAPIYLTANWDIRNIEVEQYNTRLEANEYSIQSKSEYLNNIYELNGGFLFLGIVIGIIFLTGTVLITYYKQISEGFEDREKYQTMKKVGLSDEMIKKSSSSQIGWMFYGPLAVATIHCLGASKIIYQLLGLFAIRSFSQYAAFLFSILGIFLLVYFLIFKLTSRAYYRIVS